MKKKNSAIGIALVVLVLINLLGSFSYSRFDLTEDKRYTLSNAAKTTVDKFTKPIVIDVLLDGTLPPEFEKLKVETQQLLVGSLLLIFQILEEAYHLTIHL